MHPTLFHGQIRTLLLNANGAVPADFQNGLKPMLLGAPVNFVNVMAPADTSGQLLAAYGDMGLGAYFGDRRSVNYKILNELYAESDEVGVQVTERCAIEVANPEVLTKVVVA
jgi:HK97 family phage major capsid protein